MSRFELRSWLAHIVAAALLSAPAAAKPWNGIHPGASSALDVIGKFGDPSKKVTNGPKEILVYSGTKAIKGTVQAQFKIAIDTQIVERIDVYPEPILDAEAIEKSYGKPCEKELTDTCYVKKQSASKHTYYLYAKLGLAVFFKDDGKTVQSFAFLPGAGASSGL